MVGPKPLLISFGLCELLPEHACRPVELPNGENVQNCSLNIDAQLPFWQTVPINRQSYLLERVCVLDDTEWSAAVLNVNWQENYSTGLVHDRPTEEHMHRYFQFDAESLTNVQVFRITQSPITQSSFLSDQTVYQSFNLTFFVEMEMVCVLSDTGTELSPIMIALDVSHGDIIVDSLAQQSIECEIREQQVVFPPTKRANALASALCVTLLRPLETVHVHDSDGTTQKRLALMATTVSQVHDCIVHVLKLAATNVRHESVACMAQWQVTRKEAEELHADMVQEDVQVEWTDTVSETRAEAAIVGITNEDANYNDVLTKRLVGEYLAHDYRREFPNLDRTVLVSIIECEFLLVEDYTSICGPAPRHVSLSIRLNSGKKIREFASAPLFVSHTISEQTDECHGVYQQVTNIRLITKAVVWKITSEGGDDGTKEWNSANGHIKAHQRHGEEHPDGRDKNEHWERPRNINGDAQCNGYWNGTARKDDRHGDDAEDNEVVQVEGLLFRQRTELCFYVPSYTTGPQLHFTSTLQRQPYRALNYRVTRRAEPIELLCKSTLHQYVSSPATFIVGVRTNVAELRPAAEVRFAARLERDQDTAESWSRRSSAIEVARSVSLLGLHQASSLNSITDSSSNSFRELYIVDIRKFRQQANAGPPRRRGRSSGPAYNYMRCALGPHCPACVYHTQLGCHSPRFGSIAPLPCSARRFQCTLLAPQRGSSPSSSDFTVPKSARPKSAGWPHGAQSTLKSCLQHKVDTAGRFELSGAQMHNCFPVNSPSTISFVSSVGPLPFSPTNRSRRLSTHVSVIGKSESSRDYNLRRPNSAYLTPQVSIGNLEQHCFVHNSPPYLDPSPLDFNDLQFKISIDEQQPVQQLRPLRCHQSCNCCCEQHSLCHCSSWPVSSSPNCVTCRVRSCSNVSQSLAFSLARSTGSVDVSVTPTSGFSTPRNFTTDYADSDGTLALQRLRPKRKEMHKRVSAPPLHETSAVSLMVDSHHNTVGMCMDTSKHSCINRLHSMNYDPPSDCPTVDLTRQIGPAVHFDKYRVPKTVRN